MFELDDRYMGRDVIILVSSLVHMFEFFHNQKLTKEEGQRKEEEKGRRKKLFGDMPILR